MYIHYYTHNLGPKLEIYFVFSRGAYVEEALVYAVISGKPLIQPFNATVNDAMKDGYKISCKLKNCGYYSAISKF